MSACPACGTPGAPYSLPMAQDGTQIGTVLVTAVPEGYECRWYKLPPMTGAGVYYTPVDELEFLFGGLYGKEDRKLIRPLDA